MEIGYLGNYHFIKALTRIKSLMQKNDEEALPIYTSNKKSIYQKIYTFKLKYK